MQYTASFRAIIRRFRDIEIIFLFLTILVFLLFRASPSWAEIIFGGFWYPTLRYLYDYTFGWLPFPTVYLWLIVVLLWWGSAFRGEVSFREKAWRLIKRILLFVALFYWTWGYNYLRPNLKTKLEMTIPEVNSSELFCFLSDMAGSLRDKPINWIDTHEQTDLVQEAVIRWLESHQLQNPGDPSLRRLYPKGILLGINTAGIFIPYSLEPHIDAGLHPLIQPFVMAHELGHAYSFTDEGECNFIGAVACFQASDPSLQYSARLQIVRWLFGPLVRLGYDAEGLRLMLPDHALKDLKSIREHHDQFPTYFPDRWRNAIYDQYLKSQGVESGLQSYSEVVGMLMAWHLAQNDNQPSD